MAKLVFYSGTYNASSWAMRAWLSLRAAKVDFEEVPIDIRKPQRFVNLRKVAAFSPSATVPALLVDGEVIFDSMAIMEFANDSCRGDLLPANLVERARARSLMAWQHAGLSGICSRISFESAFYPYKRPLTGQEQTEVSRFCAAIEPCLRQHDGPYLFGRASLSDYMLAPAAIRLLRHQPDLSSWPKSAQWMADICADPLVSEWLSRADPLPPIWFDDYLAAGDAGDLQLAGALET
ncbi:glutathione S-transferase family protein [Roseibium sp. RKSG952]|uniref:glutathione S-transferase family protein n=1 Tax=Roseibium sp. RKSG952 TaxID=2529384 RepID=UPI0012BC64E7|nr:glutathione S-transferase family protein [Roseibium sp. RKSG952]MTI00404.1 glutathione S-transferase family protein [Roseibium sp. RKSG952]